MKQTCHLTKENQRFTTEAVILLPHFIMTAFQVLYFLTQKIAACF